MPASSSHQHGWLTCWSPAQYTELIEMVANMNTHVSPLLML